VFNKPIFIQIVPINVLNTVFILVEMFMPALVPKHARELQKNSLVWYYKWKKRTFSNAERKTLPLASFILDYFQGS